MNSSLWQRGAVALLPVFVFLLLLVLLDSFKLLTRRAILASIGFGAAAALGALLINTGVTWLFPIGPAVLRRYVAPVVEETLKALPIVFLIRASRVGFNVDAALHGFAVGAGFACVENALYLGTLADPNLALWTVRGLGTAMMHGTATAIFAIVSKSFMDRSQLIRKRLFLPGWLIAACLHSAFNHCVVNPLTMTAILLLVPPVVFVTIFDRSARATRAWLGTGFDQSAELLDMITTGDIRATPVGQYLLALQQHFAPAVVADMLCYLRVRTELSMRAKVFLMAKEAGLAYDIGDDLQSDLEELAFLEKSLGPTGRMALQPFLHTSRRELWQMALLGKRSTAA